MLLPNIATKRRCATFVWFLQNINKLQGPCLAYSEVITTFFQKLCGEMVILLSSFTTSCVKSETYFAGLSISKSSSALYSNEKDRHQSKEKLGISPCCWTSGSMLCISQVHMSLWILLSSCCVPKTTTFPHFASGNTQGGTALVFAILPT